MLWITVIYLSFRLSKGELVMVNFNWNSQNLNEEYLRLCLCGLFSRGLAELRDLLRMWVASPCGQSPRTNEKGEMRKPPEYILPFLLLNDQWRCDRATYCPLRKAGSQTSPALPWLTLSPEVETRLNLPVLTQKVIQCSRYSAFTQVYLMFNSWLLLPQWEDFCPHLCVPIYLTQNHKWIKLLIFLTFYIVNLLEVPT